MNSNLNTAKAVNAKTALGGSSRARNAKLTKELQDHISQLRTELSVERSNNHTLLYKKAQELKKAQRDGGSYNDPSSRMSVSVSARQGCSAVGVSSSVRKPILNNLDVTRFGETFILDRHTADGDCNDTETTMRPGDCDGVDDLQCSLSFDAGELDVDHSDGPIANGTWTVKDPPSSLIIKSGDAEVNSPNEEEKIAELTAILERTLSSSSSRQNTAPACRNHVSKTDPRNDKENEKHWQLQKKVFDLTSQMSQMEKRITALKEENEMLKKKGEELKASDEKVKQLKKRNAELAGIARKLEDRLKQSNSDTNKQKKRDSSSPSHESLTSLSRNGKLPAKENAKFSNDKDKTIEILRDKCQELIRLLTAQQSSCSIEPSIESSQLAVVIKQAAKERLLLEKQLADVQRVDPVVEAQLERAAQLEDLNANLENEVSQLSAELAEKDKLEIEVMQRRVEVEMLDKEISETKLHCGKLEKDLNDVLVTNTELTAENSALQQQVADLERIRTQYEVLETQLKKSEQEVSATKTEMNKLRTNFLSLQQQVQAVSEEKVKLEADKDAAAMQLNQKQLQIDDLIQLREKERKEHANKMTSLESHVLQIEEQCRQHEADKLSMSEEIERLRDCCARQQQLIESVQKVPQKSLVNNDEDTGNAEHGQDCPDHVSTIVDHVLEPVERNEMAVSSEEARQYTNSTSRTSGMVYLNKDAVEPACDDGLEDEEMSDVEDTAIDQANQSLPVSVFVVLYDYEPHESSPNENPDLELELRAGDYVFIYGDMDEDGFFEGELADGRRGLVPSNFVSQIPPEEAAELFALMAMQSAQGDSTCLLQSSLLGDSNATSLLQAFGSSMDEINNMVSANQLSGASLADAPLNVQIESGPDHGSLIVNWLPVTLSSAGTSNGLLVKGYWVLVNGTKIKLVPNPTGDHVLLEYEDLCNVDCPRYVTVRTVTVSGQESQDSPRAFLSQQLIQDLTAGLLSTSQVSDSAEDAKRYTSRSDVVHRPIPQLAGKHLSSAAEQSVAVALQAAESRRSDVQMISAAAAAGKLQSKSAAASFTDVSRSTSDVRADKAGSSSSSSIPHRANTVPPGLKTHVSSVIETCSGNETVECPVEIDCSQTEPAVDEKAEVGRSYGINVHKQMAQSLIELSGSGSASASQQMDDNHSKQMRSSSPSNNLHQATLSAVGNQSLIHSVACSMTALDSALTSTYFQEVRPSNVTIGGGGVWRRIKPQNSGSSSGGAFSGPVRTVRNGTESPPEGSFIKPVRGAVPVHSQTCTVMSNNDSVEIKKVTAFVVVSENDEARGEMVTLTSDLSEVENMAVLDVVNDSSSDALCQDLEEPRQRKLDMAADVEDDTTRQTISELFDNNMVTSHHLRDDIPDSELIDYSDDGGESLVDNSLSMNGGPEQVRIFVALFDYDPSTMSPNPDAIDVEIPFREGQIMLIYGDQDADGFYIGECNGHRGLVPSNMVSLVEVDDPDLALQLLRDGSQSAIANGSVSSSRASSRTSGVTTRTVSTVSQQGDRDVSLPADGPVRYMIAVYSYDPQELSPNIDADQELKFERGQVIAVYGDVDDDGFYYGEVDGRCGLVPSNFVQDAPIKFIAASSSSS